MWDKRRYATHVVSNLTFDPAVVRGLGPADARPRRSRCRCCWASRARSSATKLLAMATRIGVGESTRFLAKHKGTFARLAAPGGFTGERFLEQCAPALGDARTRSSRACTSSRSTRSPRPRPGASELLDRLRG